MDRPLNGNTGQEYCENQVKHHDRDRYLTALFSPADRRPGLFALYAFNLEVAKIREMVSEPLLGQIRLQWWREALEGIYGGAPRRHLVVEPLAETIHRYHLPQVAFEVLIDWRERDLNDEAPETLDDLIAYAAGTSSTLVSLALQTLGVGEDEIAAHDTGYHVGIAWALAGLLRARPQHADQGRNYLPAGLVADYGEKGAIRHVAATALEHLSAARAARKNLPKAALPALLPAVLAGRHLRRQGRAPTTSAMDQLALYLHAFTGRY